MKEKIVDSLWQQIDTALDWIKQAREEQNIELLGWCTDYLNLTKQSLLSLQDISLPTAPEEKLEINRGLIPQGLTGFQRQGLSVLLGLTEGQPQTLTEAARMAWPDEFTEDKKVRAKLSTRISWVKSNGSAKLKQLLQENASLSPEDAEFLKTLKEKYPGITAEKVDEFLKLGKKEKKEASVLSEPETEWLKPFWAAFFHPDGPSLEPIILTKRTGLSEDFIQPCINGGIKSLQEIIDKKISEPEPEALEFIAAFKAKWPEMSLEEIIHSIRGEKNASARTTDPESGFDS